MPKPRDPVINVIHYFESAELPLAQQALSMATAIVKGRTPKPAKPARSSRKPRSREVDVPLPLN